jgi:sulfate adenylyltransferase
MSLLRKATVAVPDGCAAAPRWTRKKEDPAVQNARGHTISILPHGGTLVDRVLRGPLRDSALQLAETLPRIPLSDAAISDVELIAYGVVSPITGFMEREAYDSVVSEMRLPDGTLWPMPITLDVGDDLAESISVGDQLALCDGGKILAIMEVRDRYTYDKRREAQEVYKTTEDAHPGVARLYAQGDVLLGGPIWLLNEVTDGRFDAYPRYPAQTRAIFAERGWRSIVAFQTRNPIHRAHEYLQKTALEMVDGLLLHPLVGETKGDDVPADVRMRSYRVALDHYYPADRVVLGVFPAAMRYAGPREAIFHALCRKNYGCTHFIVGRDHAGVGTYYGTYDAQNIFDAFSPEEIGIIPLRFEYAFYCTKCGTVVSSKTCPHSREDYIILSGTQVREMLRRGEAPPPEFTRPEVAQLLIEAMRGREE